MSIRSVGFILLGLALDLVCPVGGLPAEPAPEAVNPIVERILVLNNRELQAETLLYYVSTKPGDRYDEHRLKKDFRRLWQTGFLDDLVLDVTDGTNGKIVRFRVAERKRVRAVDFRGSKKLSKTVITDELKKREAQLQPDSFFDLAKTLRVEAVVTGMLRDEGYPFANVTHSLKDIGGGQQELVIAIEDGPRAKVKAVVFEGNEVFPDAILRGQLKKIKSPGFWNRSWIGGKTTFTEAKWQGDAENPRGDRGRLEDFYLKRGFVTAAIGAPHLEYVEGTVGRWRKKPAKLLVLTIPVSEGEAYRVGEVKVEGLTVLKEEFVRSLFVLKRGDLYDEARLKKGFDKLRQIYGALGYFQWTGGPKRAPDPTRHVVDVTLAMEEDKRYYVGDVRFTGNDRTRDKVIRRELYMNEGDVFNAELLMLSIKRINQLGYFKPIEEAPEIQPHPSAPTSLDVGIKLEEQGRNEFALGGGMSGLEGAYFNANARTTNLLGTAESFNVAVQVGPRTRIFDFSLGQPFVLDKPIGASVNVYSRYVAYPGISHAVAYLQGNKGVSFTTAVPISRFSRIFATYAYEAIDIYGIQEEVKITDTTTLEAGRRYESRISPSISRSTVDNPLTPRSGTSLTATLSWVGGWLGGTTNYFRPTLQGIAYVPLGRKTAFGFRGEAAYIRPFGTTTELPYYQRVFLGGENEIRGYNVRTVTPMASDAKTAIGGNKYLLFNAEYYVDVLGPLRMLLFFDAGEAYLEGQSMNWRTLRTSTGAEARMRMPVLNVPFRLIFAYNPNRDAWQPKAAVKFAVGTTF